MSRFSPVRRTAAAAAISGGVAVAALGAGVAPAFAKTTHHQKPKTTTAAGFDSTATTSSAAQSVVADYDAGNFAVQFSAQKASGAADDQATGTFSAHMLVGSTSVASLAGPVTCLDEDGPYIGLFYPVTSSSPSVLGTAFKGVYITLELGRSGQPLSMAFRPAEVSGVSSCAPGPGMIPILSGTATVNGSEAGVPAL